MDAAPNKEVAHAKPVSGGSVRLRKISRVSPHQVGQEILVSVNICIIEGLCVYVRVSACSRVGIVR